MDPKNVIVAKRRGGALELLSEPNQSPAEVEQAFMPFRLTRTHSDYEWAALCSLNAERLERFDAPPVTQSESNPKKGKSK